MEKRTCGHCGGGLLIARADAKFCSTRCRVAAHRAAKKPALPRKMTSRKRWVRRDSEKRPLTTAGRAASSTDPVTWSTYSEAVKSDAGVGMGFILGDGIGCYDLDHCIEDGKPAPWVRWFIHSIPERLVFMEVSQSGTGVHIFIEAEEGAGSKTVKDGRHIERYTVGRYIAVTGTPFTV